MSTNSRMFLALALSPTLFAPLAATEAKSEASEIPEATIVATTGDCPATLHLSGGLGEPIVVELAGLTARADASTSRARVFCNARLRFDVPLGFQAFVGVPEIKGAIEHDLDGTANLSVRWFETGTPGESWLKRIAGDVIDGGRADFVETPADWQPRWHDCGKSPELNVLIDATARLRLGEQPGDESRFESISLQQFRIPSVLYRRCPQSQTRG